MQSSLQIQLKQLDLLHCPVEQTRPDSVVRGRPRLCYTCGTKPSLQRADADFLDLRLEQADDSASVQNLNEDIQGDSLRFRKLCQLTKIIQFDAYNMYLYQAVCVSV